MPPEFEPGGSCRVFSRVTLQPLRSALPCWRPRLLRAPTPAPVFVVPSRPGVPIAINGRDASWSVVEGDIGLGASGHLTPVIIGGGRPLPPRWSYHRQSLLSELRHRADARPPRGRSGSRSSDAGAGRELLPLLVDVLGTAGTAERRYGETPRPAPAASDRQRTSAGDDRRRASAVHAADRRRPTPGPPAIAYARAATAGRESKTRCG